MNNGSSHRGAASVRRLTQAHPTWVPVHGLVHAGWDNHLDAGTIAFRKVRLTTNPISWFLSASTRHCRASGQVSAAFEVKHTVSDEAGNSLLT